MIVTALFMIAVIFGCSTLIGYTILEITGINILASITSIIISCGGGWIIGSNLCDAIYDTK